MERVVRRTALGDPALGGDRVEVTDHFGLDDRVAGLLDPEVGSPGRAGLGRTEQVADRAPAGVRDRTGRVGLLEHSSDHGLAGSTDS